MKRIITYLKDIHFLHTWSKWEVVDRYLKRDWNTDLFYRVIRVEKVCEKCGDVRTDIRI